MSRADDVASLFQRFGASSDSYLEIENTFDYREPPVAQTLSVVAPEQPAVVQETREISPVQGQAPLQAPALDCEPQRAPARVTTGPLGHLLAEVALAREAEAAARAAEVLNQAMSKQQQAHIDAQVIAVISAKGGVGKSTLSAALASTVRLPGGRTLAIDLDSQNALQYHLNVSPDTAGMANAGLTGENWATLLCAGSADSSLLRHGSQNPEERRALERFMENDSQWLARQIARMQLTARDVVVLDVPCGDARMLEQALNAASQILVVMTADAACYLTLEQMENRLESILGREQPPACGFVINRFNASRGFVRDMAEVTTRRLGDRLLGLVQEDPTLGEALAYGHNPVQATHATQGVQDLLTLGNTLISRLMNQGVQESRLP